MSHRCTTLAVVSRLQSQRMEENETETTGGEFSHDRDLKLYYSYKEV
jgi:hypothetical protein